MDDSRLYRTNSRAPGLLLQSHSWSPFLLGAGSVACLQCILIRDGPRRSWARPRWIIVRPQFPTRAAWGEWYGRPRLTATHIAARCRLFTLEPVWVSGHRGLCPFSVGQHARPLSILVRRQYPF